MAEKKYTTRIYDGHTFVFKYEPGVPGMLHIYARHLTEPVDAIRAYFEGQHVWNPEHERFETSSEIHTVYWFWKDEAKKVVIIITCFKVD